MTHYLIPERHLLCRFMCDLKIWKSTNTLGPKAEVLEGVSFTWTPVLTGCVLLVAVGSFLACSTSVSPFGIQAFLPGSNKEVVFYAELWRWKAAEIPNSFSGFTQRVEWHSDWKWSLLMDSHKELVRCVLLHTVQWGVLGLFWTTAFWTG